MLLRGYFPVDRLDDSSEEIKEIWLKHFPDCGDKKPDSGKFPGFCIEGNAYKL